MMGYEPNQCFKADRVGHQRRQNGRCNDRHMDKAGQEAGQEGVGQGRTVSHGPGANLSGFVFVRELRLRAPILVWVHPDKAKQRSDQ